MSILFKMKVVAGNHLRDNCPVNFKLFKENSVLQNQNIENLTAQVDGEEYIPVQCNDEGEYYSISWIVKNLEAHDTRVYTFISESCKREFAEIQLIQEERRVDVKINNQIFTSYVYDPFYAKPFLGSVIGPFGDSFTRLDFEIKEHPHHRSVWLAIGDVNGIDLWNEPAGVYGKQRHQKFSEITSGLIYARITAENVWTDFKEKPQVDESRTITIYNTPAKSRFIDMDITFKASYGQVEFGASKEAGPLGIRLAESMKVNNGGTMVNSYGAIGETECWGKRAEWCDYYGLVNGNILGIAVYDHPDNEHYPSYWHIRDYGLMAPNNFYFAGGKLLKPGEKMNFKYRIYFHSGDTSEANVTECYHNYINPPKIQLFEE